MAASGRMGRITVQPTTGRISPLPDEAFSGGFENEVQIQILTGRPVNRSKMRASAFLFNLTPDEVVRRSTSGTPYP